MSLGFRYKFGLILTTSLVVAGCSLPIFQEQPDPQQKTAQELLEAQGSWQIVEEQQELSPIQKHMEARGLVNTYNTKNPSQMTSRAGAPDESVHVRVLRLEKEVSSLRSDFNQLLPPLSNLIISDEKLNKTIANIKARQTSMGSEQARQQAMAQSRQPAPMQIAPRHMQSGSSFDSVVSNLTEKPAPAPAEKKLSTPKVAQASSPSIVGLRTGKYPGKTRLVLDVNTAGSYKYDLDNNEKLMVIELPGLDWAVAKEQSFAKDPIISRYSVQPSGDGGTLLAIELKAPVKVAADAVLKPNHVYGHRLMFDLAQM